MTATHFLVKAAGLRFPFAFLDGDEHHHLSRVLRARPGKRVWLIDERGVRYRAEVQEVEQDRTKLFILEKKEPERERIRIVLGQAVLKSKKMDWLVQKSTELGVTSLVPVMAVRSVIRGSPDRARLERWRRIAVEAAKQSRRNSLPTVLPPQPLRSLVQSFEAEKKLILSEGGGRLLREIILERLANPRQSPPSTVIILVGPEGGWTPEEEGQALASGFEPVSLGQGILRSETAAVAAVSVIGQFWNT